MEILAKLSKTTTKQSRRVGRGYGSKKGGHTTGRGAKGDKVRGTTKITFDGAKIKKGWIKRTPFLRGKHRLLSVDNVSAVKLSDLDKWFKTGESVTRESLIKKSGLNPKDLKSVIKVLATGDVTKSLNLQGLLVSQSAKAKIIAAGGKIE